MRQGSPVALGINPPRQAAAGVAACLALLFIFAQPTKLSEIASFGDWDIGVEGGAMQLATDALISISKVALSLALALLLVSALVVVTIGRPYATSGSRVVLAVGANAPVLMLLPMWLVAFGNSESAALAFLVFCMTAMVGYLVFNERSGGVALAERLTGGFPLSWPKRVLLILEIVLSVLRASIFQILLLGLPLALAAELIANQSGLGHIAASAFLNGDFSQLGLAAAAYIIAFEFLWLMWIMILRVPFITFPRRME